MKTLTSALAKVFASYIKSGAIPEHFSSSSKEKIDEFLRTQVLWQKSKRKVMNENQDLHQGEMLLLNVYGGQCS